MNDGKGFRIGDVIPLDQAEKTDTFFMVIVDGEKYLVDSTGKVLLKHGPAQPADIPPPSSRAAIP
ncbi:MAG TPA: hypothetical protein PKK12_11300, partial [Candidatus Aminicenantes bacterium]|nr:hypothetical protein [Candidatus Aminicenantes bacterium]